MFIVAVRGLRNKCHPNLYSLKLFLSAPFVFVTILTSWLLLVVICAYPQSEIPIGTWRIHTSYNAINTVALGDQRVFGAAHNAIMILDQSDNSITSYSKLNGLKGVAITFINYEAATHLLLVTYEDGKFDLINSANEVISFDPTKNVAFTGSKKINHIFLHQTTAYLSADYGVIVFDLIRMQVKETWRDLGVSGETLKILQSTMYNDSIFLASEKGVLAGNVNNNLLDFNNWKRFETGDFNGPVHSVSTFNGKIYAAINGSGLHHYKDGIWTKENFLQGSSFQSISASVNNLLIVGQDTLWRLSTENGLSQITSEIIGEPRFALEDPNGKLWIGDGKNGLVSDNGGTFINYLPNCPSNERMFNLEFQEGTLYALGGGYSADMIQLGNPGNADLFLNGVWSTEHSTLFDLTDIEYSQASGKIYRSSFGFGLEERDPQGNVKVFDESNSPLINTNPPGRFVNITSVANSTDGLWISNYGAEKPLYLLKDGDVWETFSFPLSTSRFPLLLNVDFYGSVWMVLNPSEGGGIFIYNKNQNATTYLNEAAGSGGLPSRSVRCLAVDRDGVMWIGTDQGVAYFIDPSDVFSSGVDAVKPIFDDRFLLRDDRVTAIAVDGGNRKWIGTERGVWLFNQSGEKLVYNFNTENSPLISNIILDIEINDQTGEVFFGTDHGLVSFRADATESNSSFQSVTVFPNPVTPNFVGTVGISGLATDAIVKITDIAGKLIWQTQANGGTATWDVQDYRGRRVPTGVYIIFAVTEDGAEHAVAKVAVVE